MDPKVLARYNSEEGADSYKAEYETKLHRKYSDRIERRLFERLFDRMGHVESLLDLPCGRGRLYALFAQHADRVVEGDWSFHMLVGNRADHASSPRDAERPVPYVRATALALPFADRSFSTVVSIRLNHHIDAEAERELHLTEVMRVADRFVVVTFYAHNSFKNLVRRARRPFNKKRSKRTMRTGRVAALAAACGFRLLAAPSLSVVGSGHRFALLERTGI